MAAHKTDFCKYWPDFGLLRPKLVAIIIIILIITYSCVRMSIFYLISLIYCKHNGMSCTKISQLLADTCNISQPVNYHLSEMCQLNPKPVTAQPTDIF
jgi:hypothetical protein